MIEFRNVHKRFGHLEVLRGISFRIAAGEKVSIVGPSGSGKSTLLRCINRLETIDSGEIIVDGQTVSRHTDVTRLRQKIGFVFQTYNLFPHLNVRDNITLGLRYVKRFSRSEADAIAWELLKRVHLEDKFCAYPTELSGGQAQRIAIARALAMDPPILLFDEITSALDPELVGEVLDTLRELSELGKTMVIVTHEIAFASEISDRVLFLDGGGIAEEGPPESVIWNPKTMRARQFFERVLRKNGQGRGGART